MHLRETFPRALEAFKVRSVALMQIAKNAIGRAQHFDVHVIREIIERNARDGHGVNLALDGANILRHDHG